MTAVSRAGRTNARRAVHALKALPGVVRGGPLDTGRRGRPEIEYSPCRAAAIAQDRLEPILRDEAIELGADVRLETELIASSSPPTA